MEEEVNTTEIKSLIQKYSKEYDLDPEIVAAVIHQESSGNRFAMRYEDGFYSRLIKNKTRDTLLGYVPKFCTLDTEKMLRSHSIGLMQIMGETAREHGYDKEFLVQLTEPEENIKLGCKILKQLFDRSNGDIDNALFMYNGGREYPAKVLSHVTSGRIAYLMNEGHYG